MTPRRGRTAPRGFARLLKECDEVSVRVPGVGYIRVTKKVATALMRSKGNRLTVQPVPELGLLLIDPVSP